jgi:hypothetical protein
MFHLKDEYIPFWRNETFRKLLRERSNYEHEASLSRWRTTF